MAVENRFVVIRHGVEVQTFMEKKAADEYDKMLDMADSLTEMLKSVPFELTESIREELSVYLAKNREDVLIALQAKKAKTQSPVSKEKITEKVTDKTVEKTKAKSAPIKAKAKA